MSGCTARPRSITHYFIYLSLPGLPAAPRDTPQRPAPPREAPNPARTQHRHLPRHRCPPHRSAPTADGAFRAALHAGTCGPRGLPAPPIHTCRPARGNYSSQEALRRASFRAAGSCLCSAAAEGRSGELGGELEGGSPLAATFDLQHQCSGEVPKCLIFLLHLSHDIPGPAHGYSCTYRKMPGFSCICKIGRDSPTGLVFVFWGVTRVSSGSSSQYQLH